MLPRRLVSIAVMLLGASMLVVPAATSAAAPSGGPPDVTALFGQAVKKVRATSPPTYSRAVVLEVDGSTQGGKVATSAAGVTNWRFVFDNQTSGSRFASASLSYRAGKGFDSVVGHRSPFLEDLRIPKAPKLTLAQAVARLERAGHTEGFTAVTLRNPLSPTPDTKPLYIFTMASGALLGVETAGGKVVPLS